MGTVRTACPECSRGCDSCFSAGHAHQVDMITRRLATAQRQTEVNWGQVELWTLKVRNAYAQTAKLGARIHALRGRQRALHEVALLNKAIQHGLANARGELTPTLLADLTALDDLLEGEARARKREWLALQQVTEPAVVG